MAGEMQVLGGRYLLKDKVGAGGMASVYRATDQVLNRTVAVKIMLPQYAGDATFAARFKQEAQAAAGLSSPYIVSVYDWGKDGDTYYIVMEYLRGTDLKSGIRSHGALDPKKVAQIGSQICGALSVAHKHEIIHRDIKPQNIMVLPDGNIKVMDFGIARAKNSHLTQDNNVLGTAHYVSPEQTRGQELGPTSDIYSLGVVMYECATGKVPFDGDDAISVALKQVNELPVPPSQVNPGVDKALENIILKCMEKDPAARFQTADELREVLNGYLAGRAVDVAEPTRVIGGMGATETRVMSDATQAMARPVSTSGATTVRSGGSSGSMDDGGAGSGKGGMSKGKVAGIVIGVIAVIAVAALLVTTVFGGGGSKVTVPNVLNLSQEQAEADIKAAGLKVGDVSQSYSDEVDEGLVMEQTPDANKEVAEDSTVDLVISQGPKPAEKVSVPDLTGMTESQANQALSALGLVGSASEESNDAEKGTVFSQSPNSGEQVDKGSTVTFKVSTGPDTSSVPGVTGMSESEATNTLSNAGFSVNVAYAESDSVDEGLVISQDPTGTAEVGSTVTITVSTGSSKVSVPNVVGKDQSTATSEIANAGLRYDVQEQASSSVAAGNVISQNPSSGKVASGTTVTIVVSTGSGSSDGDSE